MAQLLCNDSFVNSYSSDFYSKFLDLDSIIDYFIENDSINSLFLIVPTGKYLWHLRQLVTRKYYKKYNKPIADINIFRLDSFVRYCYDRLENTSHRRLISDAYKFALFEEVINKSELKYFSNPNNKISTNVASRLAQIIYGLKEDGIKPENIQSDLKLAESPDSDNDSIDISKLGDILTIYQNYESILEPSLFDVTDLLEETSECIQNYINGDFPNSITGSTLEELLFSEAKSILFYGFTNFKNPEINFLSLFSRINVPFALSIDYSVKNGPLFTNLENTIDALIKFDFQLLNFENSEKIDLKNQDFSYLSNSEFLKRFLFFRDKVIDKNPNFSSMIKIFATADRYEEVQTVCKLIKHLHIKKNVALADIAVVVKNPDVYSPLFRELLAYHRIASNIADRFSLSKSPLVIAVFTLFDLVLKGFKRADVTKILYNYYINFTYTDNNGNVNKVDKYTLLNAASLLNISGGIHGSAFEWRQKLKAAISIYEKKLSLTDDSFEYDEFDLINFKNKLEFYKRALKDFEVLTASLKFSNILYSPDEFLSLINNDIIKNFNIKDTIRNNFYKITDKYKQEASDIRIYYQEQAEKEAKALTEFLAVCNEMTMILSERQPGQKFKLAELVETLKNTVIGAKYQIHEKQNYGVTITSIEQTRGIPFKIMILCGAIDGEFPKLYLPESFLGKDLPDSELNHLLSERLDFYQFLTNGSKFLDDYSKQIYITYPKTTESGETVMSPFVDELVRLTTLKESNCIYDISAVKNALKNTNFQQNKELVNQYTDLQWIDSISADFEIIQAFGKIGKGFLLHSNIDSLDVPVYLENNIISDTIKPNIPYFKDILKCRLFSVDSNNINLEKSNQQAKNFLSGFVDKIYSVSELETYVSCPFAYFTNRILKIEEQQIEDFGISALDLGNIMHKILFEFYQKQIKKQLINKDTYVINDGTDNLPLLFRIDLEPQLVNEYHNELMELANTIINDYKNDHPLFKIDEEAIIGNNYKKGYLDIWLELEMNKLSNFWKYSPVSFELSFGFSNSHCKLPPVQISNKVKLKGKIDRVEMNFQDSGTYFLIADYKTTKLSNLPTLTSIAKGLSFQMPLYIIAMAKLLQENYHIEAVSDGAVYYLLKPQIDKTTDYENRFIVSSICSNTLSNIVNKKDNPTNADFNKLLESSQYAADQAVDNLVAGVFSLNPKNCRFCPFSRICRNSKISSLENKEN